jgi:hypothetical protein
MRTTWIAGALVIGLSGGSASDEEVALDVVHLEKEAIVGVLLERNGPGELVMLQGTRREAIDRADVIGIDGVRERLRDWLLARRPGLDVAEEWALVELAVANRLPRMARVQAYHVLVRDPGHKDAHAFLGHEEKGGTWRWTLGRKAYRADDFHERIADWSDRFVLASTHWTVETNAGVAAAVNALVDLERLWIAWCYELGPELECTEDVDRPTEEGMALHLYRASDDRDWAPTRVAGRAPHYDPSPETSTRAGNANVMSTFQPNDVGRARQLIDLGARQLLYSLLTFGKNTAGAPPDSRSHFAHWSEWGVGYWFERRASGAPGYLEWGAFALEPRVAALALERPRGGPLKLVREELTNLIGLRTEEFHLGGEAAIHRAKAQAFGAYLLEVAPPTLRRGQEVGDGRTGFLAYLRAVYGTARGHSSDALDEGLGEVKVETLGDGWRAWLRK